MSTIFCMSVRFDASLLLNRNNFSILPYALLRNWDYDATSGNRTPTSSLEGMNPIRPTVLIGEVMSIIFCMLVIMNAFILPFSLTGINTAYYTTRYWEPGIVGCAVGITNPDLILGRDESEPLDQRCTKAKP